MTDTPKSGESNGSRFHLYDIANRIIQNIRSEAESEAHQTLRSYPGNENKAEVSHKAAKIYGIEHPGSTGVIYVMDRATEKGFSYGDPEWGMSIFEFMMIVFAN